MNSKLYAIINGMSSEKETGLQAMAERCWSDFNGTIVEHRDIILTKNLAAAFKSRNLLQKNYISPAPSST
jgi:hypothetical protein